MTPIQITVPDALTAQQAELETALAGIAAEEAKLAEQRNDIQVALQSITNAVAILSGQTLSTKTVVTSTGRRPMSEEAKKRIAEGLRKSAQARALAKAAQGALPALQDSAPAPADVLVEASAPQTPVEVPADAPAVVSAQEEPAEAPADAPVPVSPREKKASRRGGRA